MVDSARTDAPLEPLARAERPPEESGGLRTLLTMLALILALIVFWEGMKAFSRANGYALNLGGVVIDLTVFNDMQLPHLGAIAQAFIEPAQRNGAPLWQILLDAAITTMGEALFGFGLGGILGFALAVVFAHSRMLQRGMLPFVVASQTVPILAIAPMIVIWMRNVGYTELAVPIIAAYLTFFPVTIYTLSGLTSVPQTSLELMQSYAASRREILWKLRIPNALPKIFTALKVSATASVVGAIIGELPSGIQAGLGIAILNFTQFYNQSPPRLWAAIVTAAACGMVFFTVIALLERLVVRWEVEKQG